MKLLVFGTTGQVATELRRHCPQDVEIRQLGRAEADLSDPVACAALIAGTDADVVINAAAYTAVDRAETEQALALTVNGTSPAVMAQAAAARGIPFLHISTDYVFDGTGTDPWQPNMPTAPLGAYGRTKLVGEQGVAGAGGAYAILRTSWVFSAHGSNFVKTMLRLGRDRPALRVVEDQIGGPTAASDIATTLLRIAARFHAGTGPSGIYHYAGQPDVSWADFAREIFRQTGLDVAVTGIPATEYPTPALRPGNSRMDCTSLERAFGIVRPDWRISLGAVLQELKEV
jgi:dTDP-4-dehydrorhamnose reductase